MGSAFRKDIARTIARSRKRFISILAICALGVTMVTGLHAACVDLRSTADSFYDSQKLFDISVVSTLGLTPDDVAALEDVEGVSRVVGTWEESTYTSHGTARESIAVKTIDADGLSVARLTSGELPDAPGEVAVTENYLTDTGAHIGDVIELQESDDAVFDRVEYRIVGTVIDATEMTNPTGSIAMRASASPDYSFFVDRTAVTSEAFTSLYLSIDGTEALNCYGDDYAHAVAAVKARVENLSAQREEARTNQVKAEANDEIDREEEKALDSLSDAEKEIDAAARELAQGEQDLAANEEALDKGEKELAQAQEEIAAQEKRIATGEDEIAQGRTQIEDARMTIEDARTQADAECDAAIAQAQAAFEAGTISEEELHATTQAIEAKRVEAYAQLDEQRAALARSEKTLDEKASLLADAKQQIADAKSRIDDNAQKLVQSRTQLSDGKSELEEGKRELADARGEFEKSKEKALDAIDEARDDVNEIEGARWYIQDRSSNATYSSFKSDAGSIEAIGYVFPAVFIVVAVLIGLTTITRMVEEERGLIGTYKSLGYRSSAIVAKYVAYALAACLVGGAIGEICGFILFPVFLFNVFEMMYLLPSYELSFDALYGLGSLLFFTIGIAGAALLVARGELKETPAALMRPKAPKAGARILLERIPSVWKRLSFLNKVTMRNLMRYKKRFFMTVFGVAGCMALLICGFAIKDSVHALSELQYGEVNRYDALVIVNEDDFDTASDSFEEDGRVDSLMPLAIDSVTLTSPSDEEALQLFVVPDEEDLSAYVNTRSDAISYALDASGMLLTRNAAELLGVEDGQNVHMKTSSLDEADVPIAHVIDGYLGNAAYLTRDAYRDLTGKPASENGFFLLLEGDHAAFVDDASQRDGVLSVTSTQESLNEFSQSFELINTVVYVIILLAAALAFVVLFTLSTTNISERVRELATIKVLGFRQKEVSRYVNKEMLLLSIIGIACGLPLGWAFSHSLTYVLKMPSIYFAVTIEPVSYLLASALTLLFTLIVAAISGRVLRKIDMIEALKSIE